MTKLDFKRIGLRKASVFPGFCQSHDGEIFQGIESGTPITTKRQAALLGYRVTCLEYHKKERAIHDFSDPDLIKFAKSNGSLDVVASFVTGAKLGFSDLRRFKTEYQTALFTNNFDKFHAAYIEMEEELPFCFASPFAPEYLFSGEHILPRIYDEWGSVAAFAGKVAGLTVFMICGFEQPGHDIEGFIRSMSHIPRAFSGSAALHTALEYAENTFFRESWVAGLDEITKLEMLTSATSGLPSEINSQKDRIMNLRDVTRVAGKEVKFI